ncbi:MAG: SDR family oxidoreductase [bacterium]
MLKLFKFGSGLKNKVVIITGAGRGIGKAAALLFAEHHARVVIVSRTEKEILQVTNQIEEMGKEALPVPADVSAQAEVSRIIEKTMDRFGRIDVLINNAGVGLYKSVIETSLEDWDNMMAVNLRGVFLCSKAVLPIMLNQGTGTIINISSGAGRTGYPNLAAYCTTKFGVLGFTQSLAKEVAPQGVKVFAVCPGATNTRMYQDIFGTTANTLPPEKIAQKIVEVVDGKIRLQPGGVVEVYR